MKNVSRILSINFGIMLLYTIAIHIICSGPEGGLSMLILDMFPVALQVIINLVLMTVNFSGGKKELGKTYLLSSILVLVIGFASCWGSSMV